MNHELQKPRVIALILEEMRADFSTELIQSALNAIPVHENIRLVVLAGKYLDRNTMLGSMRNYKTVYNSVFRLDDLCQVDGLIIHLGSMSKRRKKTIRTGYTDANKLIRSIERLQSAINTAQKSPAANMMINRLFSRMKDRAIYTLSEQRVQENAAFLEGRMRLQDFLILCTANRTAHRRQVGNVLGSIDKLGMQNASIFQFAVPLQYDLSRRITFPEYVYLQCVIRSGEVYLLPKERQRSLMREMFIRNELSVKSRGYAVFPIFYQDLLYGFLLVELSDGICERGEYIALQLGRAIFLEDQQKNFDFSNHV